VGEDVEDAVALEQAGAGFGAIGEDRFG